MTSRALAPPIGWPLLPVPDDTGQMRYPGLEQSVRDQIRVILLTRPGEQLMLPVYGAGIETFLHRPNTLETRRRLQDHILNALEAWEPRISVDRIEVEEDAADPSRLRAGIFYRLRRTGVTQRLNLTVEVEG
jgi:uncharacterized protein